MTDLDTGRHRQIPVLKAPSGRQGRAARSELPHGVVHHVDIHELLRNSAMHFVKNDASVAHLLDAKHGISLRKSLNNFTERDARRLAYGLLDARRHASAQSRDLYTAAIHHMGYRFDEGGHIHKVQHANISAAMKNPAFRVHMMVEHYVARHQPTVGHEGPASVRRPVESSGRVVNRGSGLDARRRNSGGLESNRRGSAPGL